MRKFVHLLVLMCMLGAGLASAPMLATPVNDTLDLANVPLPVQALPEPGYQVLAGDYLDEPEVVSLIANARNLDPALVTNDVQEIGLDRAYVLDLVLPQDRAWQDSPILAVQQTSVYLLDDESSSGQLVDLLNDQSSNRYVTENEPAVENGTTVATIGESGDMLRTVVSHGRVVLEVVSMDATGAPDATEHILIVQGTLDRLDSVGTMGDTGLSVVALTLRDDDNTADFAHAQQTGVHGLYRLRDGAVQPAIGELDSTITAPPASMQSEYVSSSVARTGGGTAVVSTWLASFESEAAASLYFDQLVADDRALQAIDPFFVIDENEEWTSQGEDGVYRLTGSFEGSRYSGISEVRVAGDTVLVVGYRSLGAALPDARITSALMDHQLECLDTTVACAPFDLSAALPPTTPQASPVADSDRLGSAEFGWILPELGSEWTVTERFAQPGYDRIGLQNGVSLFEIESVINHHGEPVQCVLDELHLLQEFEEHADIRLWEDAAGNTEGGNTPTSAWVVYRVEPLADERADQEYVIRIDCVTLISGSANLVIKHIAPVDAWIEEAPKGDTLRDGLLLPGASALRAKLAASAHDRGMDMIHIYWVDKTA